MRHLGQRGKRKRLLNYRVSFFGVGALGHTTETREHTDDEKEWPRFSEKEGGCAQEEKKEEIKGCVLTVVASTRQSLAPPRSGSIHLLPLAN